ncbi:histidine phosphatase family protein [Neobacillus drentensis]|uniref:histidine phosphatase family protein n=1 Tax=Neobacillus drentensis TaxID=220684 RepID=UPI002FFF2F4D
MEKKIYVIRHCEADGQSSEALLTEKGIRQAAVLAEFFANVKMNRIISSPFRRAIQSIEQVAKREQTTLELEDRLAERILSTEVLPNWLEKLEATFTDLDLKFDRGESSREAMNRIVSVVNETFKSNSETTLIVTHGNLLSLLLKYYDADFGFEQWKGLNNPDVFLLKFNNDEVTIERMWQREKSNFENTGYS